jgi:hypothetical protein
VWITKRDLIGDLIIWAMINHLDSKPYDIVTNDWQLSPRCKRGEFGCELFNLIRSESCVENHPDICFLPDVSRQNELK